MMIAAMSTPRSRDELHDLLLGFLLARDDIVRPLRFRQREIDVRIRNARPIELGEQIGLARIGVRQAHGVAAATVKRVAEMQDLGAAFAAAGRHVLAHLPIHRGLERVLDRERAAFDEKIALERRQTGDTRAKVSTNSA